MREVSMRFFEDTDDGIDKAGKIIGTALAAVIYAFLIGLMVTQFR
jgi:hypothetical protein